MSKFKIVGMMALIAFAMGIVLVGGAVAAEKGKVVVRHVNYITTIHTLKVPDMEGHINILYEAKGISSYEKWGAALIYTINTVDLIKGAGPFQGYSHTTFPDGSTITAKFEGKSTGGGAPGATHSEGTWTYFKGTGKFEGIQGRGTLKTYFLSPGQYYADYEGEYTLP
jgi:hypothetical protein